MEKATERLRWSDTIDSSTGTTAGHQLSPMSTHDMTFFGIRRIVARLGKEIPSVDLSFHDVHKIIIVAVGSLKVR